LKLIKSATKRRIALSMQTAPRVGARLKKPAHAAYAREETTW